MITAALLICLAPVPYDGDTFTCGGTKTSVRVFGIQAPEHGQPGDPESTANLAKNIAGGLICEPKGTSYSRIVAICSNAKGEDVGLAQLGGGFAVEWCSFTVSKTNPRGYYGTC